MIDLETVELVRDLGGTVERVRLASRLEREAADECEGLGCREGFGGHHINCRSFSYRVRSAMLRRGLGAK